jgi:hypothetical protein
MKSSVELGDEALWSGLDNNAMASLYQQLGYVIQDRFGKNHHWLSTETGA